MNICRRVVVLQHLLRHRCSTTYNASSPFSTDPCKQEQAPKFHNHLHPRYIQYISNEREMQRQMLLSKRRNTPRNGLLDEALDFKNRIISIIDAGDLDTASDLLCQAYLSNYPRPIQSASNALLKTMYDVGRYADVESLFHFFFFNNNHNDRHLHMEPLLMSKHILMDTYFATARPEQALQYFRSIHTHPSRWCHLSTANLITKGLVAAGRINDALDIVHTLQVCNLDVYMYNNLIYGFLELHNDVQRANELFREYLALNISTPHMSDDAVVYATYMEYYFKRNMEKEAMESFQSLLDRNIKLTPKTSNLVLQVLLKYGKTLEANTLFDDMLNARASGVGLNDETFNIMVDDCFRLGKVSEALQVFNNRKGSDENANQFCMGTVGYNNMIGKLFDIEMVTEADEIFLQMLNSSKFLDEEKNNNAGVANVTSFRILFDAYFKLERIDDVLKWFNFMLFETTLNPNSGLVYSVFCRLVNKGRIDEAANILVKMPERSHVPFWYLQQLTTSYKVVLTQLCKGGKLEQVRGLLVQMVRYNVAVTPTLHSMVHQAFGNDGFIDQIKRLLQGPVEARDAVFKHVQDFQSAPISMQYASGFEHLSTPPVVN